MLKKFSRFVNKFTKEGTSKSEKDKGANSPNSQMDSENVVPNESIREKGKIFVGGLNPLTTADSLEIYFSDFGTVLDSVVMKFPSGKSRGFGFVTFSSPKEAEFALCKQHVLDGKPVDVRKFDRNESGKKPEKRENKFKVFVGGLPPSVSPENLKMFFDRFGKVSEVFVPVDKVTKKQKGYGFVCFETEDAAQKCLSCEFVHFGGRKIHLKRAEPRSNSKSMEIGDDCCNCFDLDEIEANELDFCVEKESLCTSEDECSSVASGETIGKEDSQINKLFADYFSAKFANLNNMNTTGKNRADNNISDIENLLREFLIEWDIKNPTSNENLIQFSDDSESESEFESESEQRSSSVDPGSSDDGCNGNTKDSADAVELIRRFSELLASGRDSLLSSSENLVKENKGGKCDKKTAPSAPLKFRGSQGSLYCPLCEWTAEDNACESFLSHCKTASHRMKLRGRFSKNDYQTTKTEECEPVGKGGKKAEGRKSPVVPRTGNCSKKQSKIPETKSKETDKNSKPSKPIQKGKKAKDEVKEGNVKTSKTPGVTKEVNSKQDNTEAKKGELKKLKVRALAKGMSCIQALADGRLKCNMCEKVIPESMDFNLLMKNVTCHLQSKRHLQKLLETEESLKNLSEKSQTKSQSCNNAKDLPSNCDNTKKSAKKKKKTQQVAPVEVQQNSQKQSIPLKSSDVKNQESSSKPLMLCIPCNFFNKKTEAFAAHLQSSSHFNCWASKDLKTDLSLNNMIKCKYCKILLYGSLFCINTHLQKCLKKKTKPMST